MFPRMNTSSNFSISSFEPAHTVIVLLSIHTLYNEMSQETDQYVQLIWGGGGGDPGETHTQNKDISKVQLNILNTFFCWSCMPSPP